MFTLQFIYSFIYLWTFGWLPLYVLSMCFFNCTFIIESITGVPYFCLITLHHLAPALPQAFKALLSVFLGYAYMHINTY